MTKTIKRQLKEECECYLVGNKIVCFLVGRFLYLGKPSDKNLDSQDDLHTIDKARKYAMSICNEYIKNVEFSKAI